MNNRKKIVFCKEVYGEPSLVDYIRREVLPYVPYFTMEDLREQCDIKLTPYGYVHDTGFEVAIIDHGEPRHGAGWDGLDKRYSEMYREAADKWQIAAEYGYH